MSDVLCSVCDEEIGRGPAGLGLLAHSRKHRRQFEAEFGREPTDYDEVREELPKKLSPVKDPAQPTIWETILDDEQHSIADFKSTS